MWFRIPEIAEKSARIMVGRSFQMVLPAEGLCVDRASVGADQPVAVAVGAVPSSRLGDDDGVNVREDSLPPCFGVHRGDDGALAHIDHHGKVIEHDQ